MNALLLGRAWIAVTTGAALRAAAVQSLEGGRELTVFEHRGDGSSQVRQGGAGATSKGVS